MNFWDAIIFSEVPFCLIPEVLNSIDMIVFVGKKLRMVNAIMLKFRYIQDIIRSITICIHNAVWLDFLPNNRYKRCRFRIVNDLSINLTTTF